MVSLCAGLAHTQPEREFALQLCVRQEQIAAQIQPFHQKLIGRISRSQTEADEIELYRSGHFEARIVPHPNRKLLRQPNVLANVLLQAFNPVVANYKPELERTKPAT